MKKFIFILGIILSINCAIANSLLDNLENSLYGFTYTTENDNSRLLRIEQTVYGHTNENKSTTDRINLLKKDMSADLIGQEIPPKEDTFAEDDDKIVQEPLPPAGANVDYPSINELEKEVFKTEYKTTDLNSRLANLEKKTFGQTYDKEPFSTRVERLQAKIKPKSFLNNNIAQSSNDFYDEDVIPLDKNYKLDEYKIPDFDYDSYNAKHNSSQNIISVEKSIFKKSFSNDEIKARLSRLESTMFGTTFDEDSDDVRINRITSAYRATKSSSKYDSNKFAQNMATAMQIGTIILMILACVL
jgi:hypothetical protein